MGARAEVKHRSSVRKDKDLRQGNKTEAEQSLKKKPRLWEGFLEGCRAIWGRCWRKGSGKHSAGENTQAIRNTDSRQTEAHTGMYQE